MSLSITLGVLALAALGILAHTALYRRWRRIEPWLSLLALALLTLCLRPPGSQSPVTALTLITPGAVPEDLALARYPPMLLPDSLPVDRLQTTPDLATLRRRDSALRTLQILGDGLPARDQDAARGLTLTFAPRPVAGVIKLDSERSAGVGRRWAVSGTVGGKIDHLQLLDPSGQVVDSTKPDTEAHFTLAAVIRGAGPVRFSVRAFGRDGQVLDTISQPLVGVPSPPQPSLLILAATPDPDLKYLRRWATDAGLQLRSRIGLSRDLAMTEGDPQIDTASLASTDLLIADERSWAALSDSERQSLVDAVDQGMGLLFRVTGKPDATVASQWLALGLPPLSSNDAEAPVEIGLSQATRWPQAPILHATGGSWSAPANAVPLLTADDGRTLAIAVPHGAGRIGLWTLLDSWRLRTAGRPDAHASLWADTLGAISRPRPANDPSVATVDVATVMQRHPLCGLSAGATLNDPDAHPIELRVDEAGCAAWWPAVSGWYALQAGQTSRTLYVRDASDGAALRAHQRQQATGALADAMPGSSQPVPVPWPRWPLFLLWLLCVTVLWWRERQAGENP